MPHDVRAAEPRMWVRWLALFAERVVRYAGHIHPALALTAVVSHERGTGAF